MPYKLFINSLINYREPSKHDIDSILGLIIEHFGNVNRTFWENNRTFWENLGINLGIK